MAACCDLEADINGEETFLLNKKIICSYSGRLRKLLRKSTGSKRNKVIFHDFPGGAENFDLIARFCYNNGEIDVNPSNISLLYSAAEFMEMNDSVSGNCNLLEKTKKCIEEIGYWTWPDLLVALKHCQDLQQVATSGILEKCLDSIVGRLAITSEASPCASTSSPDSSGFRFSCDTRSTESLKNSFSRVNWWFDDLSVLSPDFIEMLIKTMVSRKYNHMTIGRFLFYYQKSKFFTVSSDEKCKVLEVVIDMLYTLDPSCVSCKSLFGILRVLPGLNISKSSRNKLESMIGSQMDQVTLDSLLIPSPYGTSYLYDVNLILRFLNAFLCGGGCRLSPARMKKVASLMDLYIAEVAPDPFLRSSKFLALVVALPDSARDCWDELYHAMDVYLEVHAGLSEEEKLKICCALNYEKLSSDACIHLSQNTNFPSKTAVRALVSQQLKLKNSLLGTKNTKLDTDSPRKFSETRGKAKKGEDGEQIVLYSGKLDISADNENLRTHLQGMQWRVIELEKLCKKMQNQMTKLMKSKVSTRSTARSVPRLCS
ncbi:Phototropic-responsive NPH3 family protein, putative isoform 2 [Hibiscus syriacus]|uniref:Phototropic-responsive NPH3 family protein, putative isoform 2 n=1 Tax=Hibiscus syriacus TaxID=106335 RepID=A0A6A2WYM0_HIBSY|nr:BTB/POZ domain-containing protein At3g22104-like [Hibiscus syriacus]KAE8654806.1 Phototropic-responsive NPH3 family protein, putative isoform 2 [Hibiscus syriacus]